MPKQQTVISLFCGAGGKTQGAIDAGYQPIYAIDYWQPAIDSYKLNIKSYAECKNLMDLDPRTITKPDLLMASPPCPNYSAAKIGGKETMIDIWLSMKTAQIIGTLKPKSVIIENVPAYQRSKACGLLVKNMALTGYAVTMDVINAADLGTPQTRRRLIIRATRIGKTELKPIALTHDRLGRNGLLPWVGWYSAIEDLIPSLPVSKLTDRQMASVVAAGGDRQLIQRIGYYGYAPKSWDGDKPIGTIRASLGEDGRGGKRDKFMDCWLLPAGGHGLPRSANSPATTITANAGSRTKAVGADIRLVTPKALQRLQGLPDSWILPDDPRLSVRMIGNSVVPIVAQAACESIVYL